MNATDTEGGTLTFSLDVAPTGMTINASTGLIQWTPSSTGNYQVTVRVTDLGGLFATQSFTITVNPMLIHIGDLDRNSANIGGNRWRAFVRATVHNGSHALMSGALMSGSWSAGDTNGRTLSCTTDASGTCSVQSGRLNRNTNLSVTFTVNSVTKAGATYQPGSNHDPDGDSNGTSITVPRP
ncbi:MAG: hypothetical protein A2V90_05725 [Gammaproteobacteria bacterium RBG_16_57_12]|nr:MAG: hypothetical protein A2V90_05725 [Gammaproteobacteria bacterium RBG_16_57_12]